MSHYAQIREECCEANRQLRAIGLVDLTFGNVSVIDRASGVFAIKPSGVGYAELTPEMIVLVDLEGKVVEGKLRYSSDTPTHRRLFQAFTGASSIVHTHSRHATAFAQAGRPIPCLGTTHADYFYGEVPVTRPMTAKEIGGEYEWETGNVIAERFREINPDEMPAVLVHGHAPFVWGPSATKAVENAQALEIVAEMARKTLQINPQAEPLSPELLDKHFRRKHGAGAYYGQKANFR
jgi:L-ribulose-5-phosphate 4-epimerase